MNPATPVPNCLFAALVLITCIAAGPAPSLAQEREAIGEVVDLRGVALVLREGRTQPLALGAPVFRRDRIVTAADATFEISFEDGSRLAIGADSDVELTEFAPGSRADAGRGIISLLIGIIRTSLADMWTDDDFEIRTRAAVASVRSTDWVTEAKRDTTAVFVVSGEVAVAGTQAGRSVTLQPGFGTDVDAGGPSAPARWGEARVRDVIARTQVR